MEEKNKISIIIPVYNAEKKIGKTIESITNQTYRNLEVIVVNDGSVDNTCEIVEGFSKKDDRIILLNKENSGVSDTRNYGIKKATGDYIGFVDADDFVEVNMYEELLKNIIEANADLALCSFYKWNNEIKSEQLFPWKESTKIYGINEIYDELLPLYIYNLKGESSCIFGTVWRLLYKAEIAKKIQFDSSIKIAEDLLYIIESFRYCKTVIAVNKPLYNYVEYSDSSMRRYKPDLDKTNHLVHEKLEKLLKECNFFEKNMIRYQLNKNYMYTTSISNNAKNKEATFGNQRNYVKKIIDEFNSDKYINKKILKQLNIPRKILYIAMKLKFSTIITLLFKVKEGKKSL